MTLETGQVLNNRYRVVRLLGQGVYGAVYRAWDTSLQRPCVLKENYDASPEAVQQFVLDASMLANLRHPALPKVSDYFSLLGQGQYLVMEFIEGQDLQEKVGQAGGPLAEAQVLPWVLQVCDALIYLHSLPKPIFHCDLSPTDIRITPDDRAVLVDFGLNQVYDPVKRDDPASCPLTPGFAPVERYGQQPADARTVVYSLGAIVYYMLSGQVPPESITRGTGDTLLPLHQFNTGISEQLDAVITKRALAVEPGERWQSMEEFRYVLSSVQSTVGLEGAQSTVLPVEPAASVDIPAASPEPLRMTDVIPPEPQPRAVEVAAPPPPQPVPVQAVPPSRPESRKKKAKPTWYWLAGAAGLILAVVCVAAGVVMYLNGGFGIGRATNTPLAEAPADTETPVRPTRMPTSTSEPRPTDTEVPATQTATILPTDTPTSVPPTLTPTQAPKIVKDALGVEMAVVPAGEFTMGINDGGVDHPAHVVNLDEYLIDVYEVTNARYAECVKAGKCLFKPHCSAFNSSAYANFSVVCVSWSQAQTYCEWRGGSLPTEAQWEKASRGGLEGKLYPWGDEEPTCEKGAVNGAQFLDCTPHSSAPVGNFGANGYGLYDMAGNVWEWVWDWYLDTYYVSAPLQNPTGPESGQYRGSRGGSWFLNATSMRNAFRGYSDPNSWGVYVGFRCAGKP